MRHILSHPAVIVGLWIAGVLTVVLTVIFSIVNIYGWDGQPDRPSRIELTNGDTLTCVDTSSYGWGADGWECEQPDGGSISIPKERVLQVIYS